MERPRRRSTRRRREGWEAGRQVGWRRHRVNDQAKCTCRCEMATATGPGNQVSNASLQTKLLSRARSAGVWPCHPCSTPPACRRPRPPCKHVVDDHSPASAHVRAHKGAAPSVPHSPALPSCHCCLAEQRLALPGPLCITAALPFRGPAVACRYPNPCLTLFLVDVEVDVRRRHQLRLEERRGVQVLQDLGTAQDTTSQHGIVHHSMAHYTVARGIAHRHVSGFCLLAMGPGIKGACCQPHVAKAVVKPVYETVCAAACSVRDNHGRRWRGVPHLPRGRGV